MNPSEQLKQLMQGHTKRLESLANNVLHGDCVERLRECPDNMFTACVTDPPYDLGKQGFMGKSWDRTGVAFDPKTWEEVLRVTKPGGMLCY
jgi:site-specific DNA-methyltransferase (adenine-specific)